MDGLEMSDLERGVVQSSVDDWRNPQAYDNIKIGDNINDGEERIFWNEPDGIVIRKAEYGGVLQKNWESSKDKLCGRFFFPDGNSLTWDVCARDRLRDFNLVCLKCGDVFQCAPNNMTRTGNRHIKSKHPNLKCISAAVPFYKQRNQTDPISVGPDSDPSILDAVSASNLDSIPLASSNISKLKPRVPRCNEIDKRRLDRYVSALIARCGLPANLTDNPVFKEFVEELTNSEYIPGDAVLVEKEQDKMYTCLMEDLKLDYERQAPNTYFSMNADIWSFRSDVSIIVMNSYCIDSRWRYLKSTAAVRAVPTDKVASIALETAAECMACFNRTRADRLMALTSPTNVTAATALTASTNLPAQTRLVGCACFQVQNALKELIYGNDNLRLQPIRDFLRKCTLLVSQLLNSTAAHAQLANLCLELEPNLLDHPHPSLLSVDDRLDSEFVMLSFLYRMRRALVRGWEQHRLMPVSSQLMISDGEWALCEQLLALFGLINNFNRALTARTVSLSKVYPQLIVLYRNLTSTQLACPTISLQAIAAKCWDHDMDDSVLILRQQLSIRIEQSFPLVNSPRTLDKWNKVDLDKLEPYVLSMAMDPMISSNYSLFRNPQLSDQVNNAIIASLKEQEIIWVQQAVARIQSQYGNSNRHSDVSLLSTADGYMHHGRVPGMGMGPEEALYGVSVAAVAPNKIYGGGDDVTDEASELFSMFSYIPSPFENPMEPEGPRLLRLQWEEAGGWAVFQKSAELLWWEKHGNMFPCLSKLAAAYLAIPASTYGMDKFASPDGPQSLMGCMGHTPTTIEKTLFVRENFYNGLLDVQISGISGSRKRKRTNKSSGGLNDASNGAIEIPDHNRQQPPKYLHRLITSSVSLEGEVNWKTKVMKPTGDIEYKAPLTNEVELDFMHENATRMSLQPTSPALAYATQMGVGVSAAAIGVAMPNTPMTPYRHPVPDMFDTYEWKLGMRHTIRMHLETVRGYIVSSGYHFKVDNSCKSFEL